ncbi:MAG: DUF2975 domain-containing protein [Lachnospiraceae bacterium]|nr:DUF2975 domain-containing protein [Lachnospiraceae bacterium]
MNSKLTKVTKLILDIMYFLGIPVCLSLPITFKLYGQINSYFSRYYVQLIILFFLSGVFAILIIGELRKMFKTVLNGDCFVTENVTSLRKMGTYSFCIAIITVIRLFLYITPGVLVVVLVFLIAGLFSKVLSEVFDKAVTYKLENDFTI